MKTKPEQLKKRLEKMEKAMNAIILIIANLTEASVSHQKELEKIREQKLPEDELLYIG